MCYWKKDRFSINCDWHAGVATGAGDRASGAGRSPRASRFLGTLSRETESEHQQKSEVKEHTGRARPSSLEFGRKSGGAFVGNEFKWVSAHRKERQTAVANIRFEVDSPSRACDGGHDMNDDYLEEHAYFAARLVSLLRETKGFMRGEEARTENGDRRSV